MRGGSISGGGGRVPAYEAGTLGGGVRFLKVVLLGEGVGGSIPL